MTESNESLPSLKPYELRNRHREGTAPGTLVSRPHGTPSRLTLMSYDDAGLVDQQETDVDGIRAALDRWPVNWIDVCGVGDAAMIESLGELFGFHSLALEDVLNTHQRPKVEEYADTTFVITRMPSLTESILDLEQLSLFLGPGFVVTFQEHPGDCFNPVRERIRRSAGSRGRLLRPDYLAYALLDAVVDSYFPVLEAFSDRLDALESAVIRRPSEALVGDIHLTRRQLQALRRTAWPQRELFRTLIRDVERVGEDTRVYLRDCEDHAVQILDVVETYRERASSALDLYITSLNHRMNEAMKVLTIIATIFMPLTVITGVYGMNFDPGVSPFNMPELRWRFGYPFALGLLLAVAGGLILLFWRRGWLSGDTLVHARRRRWRRRTHFRASAPGRDSE